MNSILIIIIATLFSAFFSGLEIAFITSNKLRIELENKQGSISARVLSYFTKNPSNYLGTMLLGNNVALVIFSIYMDDTLNPLLENYINSPISILLISTLFSTLIILFFAEYLPKNIFRINSNLSLSIFYIPLSIVYAAFLPLVFIITKLSELVLEKVMGLTVEKESGVFTTVDLDNYLKEGTSQKEQKDEMDYEVQIFQNALDFSSVKARECMVPRTEIIALEVNDSIVSLQEKFIETKLSKILIYDDNIDNIIGYVYSKELFKKPKSIRQILLPVSIVPESMTANEALTIFIQQHKSIMLVVDEFGGTSGMITMEDVIEEIFGEIDDEYDKESLTDRQLDDNKFEFSARLETDYVNDKYHLSLPTMEDYETLGGLIMHHHESIPKLNEKIIIDNFLFTITAASKVRIDKVTLEIKETIE